MTTVFFDIGETLGSVEISADDQLIETIHLFPSTPDVLKRLKPRASLGIISNTGKNRREHVDAALETAGILQLFDPELLLYSAELGLKKDKPEIFELAVQRSGDAPAQCCFVGESAGERLIARSVGMRVCPHPELVEDVIDDRSLWYIRFSVPERQHELNVRSQVDRLPIVPLHMDGKTQRFVIAIASDRAAQSLSESGADVKYLGAENAPVLSALFLVRKSPAPPSGDIRPEAQASSFLTRGEQEECLLETTDEGWLVALPGDKSIDDYHPENAQHGHAQELIPNPQLLSPFGRTEFAQSARWLRGAPEHPELTSDVRAALDEINPAMITHFVDRYVSLESRHSRDPANERAVQELVNDLRRIGDGAFKIRLHPFSISTSDGPKELYNVEAELPGENSDGASSEIVITSAHLDSTASSSHNDTSPAPGADDDGSGIAGVLAVARAVKTLSAKQKPKRTIRFVFFNAEEQGLKGSKVYARSQRGRDAPIVGAFQMDMIGYQEGSCRSWELHAGCSGSPDVEARSLELAEHIQSLRKKVSPNLDDPQVYVENDPAAGRSDHAALQLEGYAGCLASEDFFADPTSNQPGQPNPYYHTVADQKINAEYAADIARVIGAAVWTKANSTIARA